jgi:tRNA A37 methylthiotransferase MiaB
MTPVPYHIVRARSERLRMMAHTMSLSYRNKFVGKALPCVIEKKKSNAEFTAVSGNYIKIALPPDETARSIRGTFASVILEEVGIGINRGRIVRG